MRATAILGCVLVGGCDSSGTSSSDAAVETPSSCDPFEANACGPAHACVDGGCLRLCEPQSPGCPNAGRCLPFTAAADGSEGHVCGPPAPGPNEYGPCASLGDCPGDLPCLALTAGGALCTPTCTDHLGCPSSPDSALEPYCSQARGRQDRVCVLECATVGTPAGCPPGQTCQPGGGFTLCSPP